jgi:ribosomal protein S18 acetylase RimI-like enzyme
MTTGAAEPPAFRLAQVRDEDRLVEFMRAFYDLSDYPFDAAAARAALRPLLEPASRSGRVWMIESDGREVGYVAMCLGHSLEYRGRDAFVDELYVEPEFRRRGFGAAAVEMVAQACAALGVRALHLEVERTNHAAQALYRRFGFEDHDRLMMTRLISPP